MRPSCKSCDTVCKKCTFLKACEKGDVERVRACLFLYPDLDVNCSTKAEHFGLYYAAKYGYSELCDFLLAHPQIDINKKGGSNKSSALIKSFFEDNDDITRKLLEAGADPNSQDDDGNTLAGLAVCNDMPGIVEILAENGKTNWNIPTNENGDSIAMEAINIDVSPEMLLRLTKIPNIDWIIRNEDDENILVRGLNVFPNKEKIKILFTIPQIEYDVDYLKEMEVYERAVEEAKQFLTDKMEEEGMDCGESLVRYAMRLGLEKLAAFVEKASKDDFKRIPDCPVSINFRLFT